MEAHSTRHDAPDASMVDILEPAKRLLETSFAAVGILEDFNTTMHLYDRALEMPGDGWPTWATRIGRRNSNDKYKNEEEMALEKAWADPRFEHFLKLDLELYDHAVKVHRDQVAQFGLG